MYKHFALLPVAALIAACGSSSNFDKDFDKAAAEAPADAGTTAKPRVIVADIDTTVNPYHEFLYAGSEIYKDHAPNSVTQEVLDDLKVPPENILTLTRTGNLTKDKKTDEAIWKSIRRGKPYWIKGTNVIVTSFCDQWPMIVPDIGKNPHGVGTSASVLWANPDAVIVLAEMCDSIGSSDAENYAFSNPAVDIITTSYGPATPVLGTPPIPLPEGDKLSFDSVVGAGKLHFCSAGNGPGFTPLIGRAGEWWTMGITGSEDASNGGQSSDSAANGQEPLSANFADFVADYSQDLPYCMDCEKGLETGVAGTSFSTPLSAGVASKIILEARRMTGHIGGIQVVNGVPLMVNADGKQITNWQIRRGLEEAAYSDYGVADFDPTNVSIPFNDAAPWLQMAWGEINPDPAKGVVAETLAQIGFGTPTRSKGADFCEFQAMNMRLRQNFYDVYSGNATPDPNPYLYCDSVLSPLNDPLL